MKKTKSIGRHLFSPLATAGFAHLQEPDSVGDYADGKWKIQLYFEDNAEFREFRDAVMLLYKGGREPFKEQEDGTFLLNPKTAHKPSIVDAKLQPITDDVYKGSKVIASVTPAPYEGGLTTYLNAVQVIELVTRDNGLSGFEVVEGGYEAEQPEFAGWVKSEQAEQKTPDIPF